MRILVIGGTSFIGPAVVCELDAAGHEVIVFHRGSSEAELPPTVRHIHSEPAGAPRAPGRLELTYPDAVRALAPDVVVHMIACTEADAHTFVAAFRRRAGRAVVISSQDVYRAFARVNRFEPGPPDPVPLSEDAPLRERLYPFRGEEPRPADAPDRWRDDYDKILVERVVLAEAALPAAVLRLPAVYGPGDHQHRFFAPLKRMDDGRRAIPLAEGLARWRWTHGYVADVAHAIALAVTDVRAVGRIYNVGEAETPPWAERVRALGDAVEWSGAIVAVPQECLPTHLDWGIDTRQHVIADTSRIRRELGYHEPTPLAEALRRTIAWERAHPPDSIIPQEYDYAAEDATVAALERQP